ncbi:hypothetical protein BTJ39_07030 [Izhakiella australiensis]|uniref:Uncharacterized protein n=1 Tax=Izhakiella australiensis TaxID=1926881 RepID=A0A1S8YPK3_9GAMM|nr:DUF2057 family protein [Izhakiella australiensis]OON40818.1 hypothetical protein BTJ39_07030 [Izhakiella australiensis]
MKLRLWCAGLLTMLIGTALHATTLKLEPEIDLLVLDGHKISGSWLKGADGIELEKGQHQFLFRVEKTLSGASRNARYISVPLIATFVAETKSVSIRLPVLETLNDAKQLDRGAGFQLINEQNQVIASQHDTLSLRAGSDAEQAMVAYNRANHIASVPRFAEPQQAVGQLSPSAESVAFNNSPDAAVLYRWYMQVDSATRQHLRRLLKALHTS